MRVVLAGARGFGANYLDRLRRLTHLVRLVGICDVLPVEPESLEGLGSPEISGDLPELIKRTGAQIAILATPIPTHADLTLAALEAGAHVLVEKPTAATLADFDRMERAASAAGLACQVGFQSLGSAAVPAVRELIADGAIGRVTGIGVAGSWPRPAAYFTRSAWAGRRVLDGVDVVDGALTNPFAHALATALAVAGAEERGAVASVETELFHANAIESDDTSAIRVTLAGGTPIVAAVTLCAAERDEPYVVVHGERGRIRLTYTMDEVQVNDGPVRRFGRTDLLENLVEHLSSGRELLVPIHRTGAFMQVMEAIRVAPEPLPIADDHQDLSGEGRVLPDIARVVDTCAERLTLFSELGVSWAVPLIVRGAVVADYTTAPDLPLTAAPRPYLHPVRTLGGVVVTEVRPQDHPHHLGAGVAVTDLGGRNFWGGRTYVRDQGPAWLDDHGVQRHVAFTARDASGFTETLLWERPGEEPLVREERTVGAVPLAGGWALDFAFTLRNLTGEPLTVRSSATKGRAGAGYGGFFWRAPADSKGLRVFTASAEGEERVHGSRAPWLALSSEEWTLLFVQDSDPWFVRVAEYPGVGTALAWDTPLEFAEELARRVTVVVADGRLSPEEAAGLAAGRR
ncbi:DUF6807 family protein [Nonomuraea sp. LPB2021202275-12-8]|uniref:DUF6807 family protein n=1 Tax=Nonomuraea sp. LPB2021202275-12-8 TaxID=3120159 RepID=UPI00300D317F